MSSDDTCSTYHESFRNQIHDLATPIGMNCRLCLSVADGFGTYSDDNGVEVAIMTRNDAGVMDFVYSMTGGDVYGWFPRNQILPFVEWFNANCNTRGFFVEVNGSNRNILHAFLRNPDRGPIQPRYTSVPIL